MKMFVKVRKSAICILFLALIAGGAVYIFYFPREPTFQGRNMGQWLRILSTNTNSIEDPLRIVQVTFNKESQIGTVEVPLSCDLVKKYSFSETNGKFDLIINGRQLTSACLPATNGHCLLRFDEGTLNPGTNQIRVWFMITNPSDVDHYLNATGPITLVMSGPIQ